MPELSLPSVNVPSPFYTGPTYGSKLIYSPLQIEFLVDEHLRNYLTIHDWMRGLGAPKDKSENAVQVDKTKYTNAILTVYNSHNVPVLMAEFLQVLPIYLGTLQFSEETQETTPVSSTATFEFLRYDIIKRT
jgi:hypothetical protein